MIENILSYTNGLYLKSVSNGQYANETFTNLLMKHYNKQLKDYLISKWNTYQCTGKTLINALVKHQILLLKH